MPRRRRQRRWPRSHDARSSSRRSHRCRSHEHSHRRPHFLPDQRRQKAHALFQETSDPRPALAARALGSLPLPTRHPFRYETQRATVCSLLRRFLLRACRFHLRQRRRNFLEIRHHRNVIVLEPRYLSRLVDDGDRAAGDAFISQVHAVLLAHRSARMKIRQQRIFDPHLLRIRLVRPHAVHADAQNFRVQRLERFHVVHEAGVLVRARRAPVQRVPHQHDILFPREIRELHFLLFLIQQRKIRRRLSNRDTHNRSSWSPQNLPQHLSQFAARSTNCHAPFTWLRRAALCAAFIRLRRALSFAFFPQYTLLQENPMSAEAPRRAPSAASRPQNASTASRPQNNMMALGDLVRLYRSHAGNFGEPVALSAFGLTAAETERLFSAYDEDYHISRFFHFSESGGQKFSINGFPATHVSLDAEIETIL